MPLSAPWDGEGPQGYPTPASEDACGYGYLATLLSGCGLRPVHLFLELALGLLELVPRALHRPGSLRHFLRALPRPHGGGRRGRTDRRPRGWQRPGQRPFPLRRLHLLGRGERVAPLGLGQYTPHTAVQAARVDVLGVCRTDLQPAIRLIQRLAPLGRRRPGLGPRLSLVETAPKQLLNFWRKHFPGRGLRRGAGRDVAVPAVREVP